MYTFYHMLSFILFIVPIFLMYLLPHLSPSSCSFRLCTAGYQKGVGRNTNTPWWLGVQQVSPACLFIILPWRAPQEGACWKSWGTLGCVSVWTVASHQPQVWRDPSTAGTALRPHCPHCWVNLVGWSWQCLTTQGCLTAKIKGNGPLGVRFEHLFWLRTSC